MATFRHERTECQCAEEEVNRRIFWLDAGEPGRSRYGILWDGEVPGPGDNRINGVTFECDLPAMIEKMLDAGFGDPPKEIAAWLVVFQHCSKRLGEELLKIQSEDGPPRRF
jgi:hypothetical protein